MDLAWIGALGSDFRSTLDIGFFSFRAAICAAGASDVRSGRADDERNAAAAVMPTSWQEPPDARWAASVANA